MSESGTSSQQPQCKQKLFMVAKTVLLPLALVFLTERFYRSDLYAQSLEDIPKMQEMKKLKKFFTIITAIGTAPLTILFYIVSINLMPKPAALYLWCSMAFVGYLTNCLQSFYAEDRPYWVSDEIVANECMLGFGNPSGLMLNNVFFWFTMYLHQYHEMGVLYRRMSVFCTAYIIKMVGTCLIITGLIFMGQSEVYFGGGSYNEVVFGALLGLTLAFIGHCKVKPFFLNMPETLYSAGDGSQYTVSFSSYFKVVIFTLILPLLLALLVLMTSTGRAFHHAHEFRIRQARAGCTEQQLEDAHSLHYLHFENAGVVAIAAGALCGQIFEYRYFVNSGLMNNSAWLWYRSPPLKIALRTLLSSVVFFVCLTPAGLMRGFEKQVPQKTLLPRALILQVCSIIVPYFLASFLAFGMLRYASFRLRLDNQGVIGQEFNTRAEYLESIGLKLKSGASTNDQVARRGAKATTDQTNLESSIEMDTL